jgi:hypothetical protein
MVVVNYCERCLCFSWYSTGHLIENCPLLIVFILSEIMMDYVKFMNNLFVETCKKWKLFVHRLNMCYRMKVGAMYFTYFGI